MFHVWFWSVVIYLTFSIIGGTLHEVSILYLKGYLWMAKNTFSSFPDIPKSFLYEPSNAASKIFDRAANGIFLKSYLHDILEQQEESRVI